MNIFYTKFTMLIPPAYVTQNIFMAVKKYGESILIVPVSICGETK